MDTNQSFPALEESILERWRERDVFHESVRRREGRPEWVFYEGPPTANGPPGSHHVLSRVFKDVFPRYKTMGGYVVHRKAGWDCHGLPVELEIEKELGFSSKEDIERYGVAEFNERCRESVLRYIDEWNRLTERIGFWIDTDDAYFTLDNDYIESVWWSLRQVWDKGLLQEGYKVVPYCTRDGTALSSHEVALGYKDVVDPSIFVRFPVKGEEGVSLLAWTTMPWTLVPHAAIAVDPDATYVRARVGDETLILAEALVQRVLGEDAEVEERLPGSALLGTAYEPPFPYISDYGPKGHTVLAGDFVSMEEGTGVVHTGAAFGEDDFRLAESNGLTIHNPVRPDGTFDERTGPFAGLHVREADPKIIEALRDSGRLFREGTYEHAYPHCWRCGTPLIYYAKSNWFVLTTEVRDQLLAANEEVTWYPEHVKHGRFGKWLEGNVDWALSRERYWGTPLPIWRCGEGHLFCAGSVADLRERGGAVPDDPHRPFIDDVMLACDECGEEMRRVPDLIDVWWDSGCMPFAQWHAPFEGEEVFRQRFPADYICEALDQTRGWFYSLLAVSTLIFGRSSYETVLCLGLILDPEGQKMSKSRGNVVVPWDVLDQHGADAFRWYYFTSKQPWDGYRFSLETVGEAVRQFLKPLWNTYGFYVLYANAGGVEEPAPGEPTELDRWILSRLQATIETAIDRLEDYDTTFAGRAIAAFVDDLSNWYVRRSRRRFWDADPVAFHTLRECLVETAKLVAPLTPFVSDEIYENLSGAEPSVHLCDYPEPDPELRDEALEWQMRVARDAVELGRAARAQAKIKLRQPLGEAVVVAADREREAIERLEPIVLDELNVKSLRYVSQADELGRFELKPNYRALGPRFGKRMPQVAQAVAALDADSAAATLRDGGTVAVNVDGKDYPLTAKDLQLVLKPLEGYQVERSGTHAVALNLQLDDSLRREGLAREVVHAVQAARKAAGLQVEDRISLTLGGDDELLAAARAHEGYVAGETLATRMSYDGANGSDRAEIEGRELRIAVERV
ncbi:MAG TPA: isoleucine--tRNA ligase [Thermoleophilaceae bacterium]|nr:isoleucine--tRNA ligase [Thermoleophilaceae bacterium]